MNSPLKRIFAAALLLLCLLALPFSAQAALLLQPGADYYVADYAAVLSDETRQTVVGAGGALETLTGGQIVVVTIDDLEGFSPEEYAGRLFEDWGVGDYKKSNGMLLLLAVGEDKACLYCGAGIQRDFDEKTRDQLLEDYFWPDFQAGSYDAAVSALFPQLIGWYEGEYGVSILNVNQPKEESGGGFAKFAVVFSIIILVLLLAAAVILTAMWIDRRRYRKYYYGIGVPMPRYRPYFFFFGGPHRPRRYRSRRPPARRR